MPQDEPERPRAEGDDMTRRDYSKDCLGSGCHAKLNEAPAVHGPVSLGACETCHTPADEGKHEFRNARPDETLCTSCHAQAEAKKVVHKPFAQAQCLECHDPHRGKTKALLAGEGGGKLCEKCHEPPKHPVLHGPVAVGECLLCHAAHQSDHEKLALLPGKDLCVKCHAEVGDLLAAAPFVHGPAAVDCAACHLPHGGEDARLLRKEGNALCIECHDSVAEKIQKDPHVHGAIEGEKGCAGCHTPHASQLKSQLRAVASELCFTCHDRELVDPATKKRVANVAREVAAAQFKHGPVRTGDCQGCHYPHSSSFDDLLHQSYPAEFYKPFSEPAYALCFECHEKALALEERTTVLTRFRDGDRNLHFLHVNREKGRTCRACHEVHGSSQPSHIRKSVPFGSGGWQLPINYQKTPAGGSCSPGCHKPKTYDNGGAAATAPAPREKPRVAGN
ncbi:MAG: hypothetical protein HY721_34415 [Planctomycetes bacterium]|nr:hypothetical protein [Planctomycetota bacterium]